MRCFLRQTPPFQAARKTATEIAENSPLVVRGIKQALAGNKGQTVEQALDMAAHWNAAYLISDDLTEAITAFSREAEAGLRRHLIGTNLQFVGVRLIQ